jgi:hypothetical protein
LPKDLFNQPYVEINCDEAKGKNSKAQVKQAVRDMFKKEFKFNWIHPEVHKTIESSGTIISTMHDIKGTNRIIINFNIWAVPFFVYYGVGVGGTRFNKTIALKLRGDYSKRIYKIISRWKDKRSFTYKLEDFRKDLAVPKSYNVTMLKKRILDKAVAQLEQYKSDIYFEYDLKCLHPVNGRKPKDDTIIFFPKIRKPENLHGDQFKEYTFVFYWMQRCYGQKSSKAQEITDKLLELGVLDDVKKRADYYDDKVSDGSMVVQHAINSLKKMLKIEFSIE